MIGVLFLILWHCPFACECAMRRGQVVWGISWRRRLWRAVSGSCGRQVSLVIPALSYINMHLITVFTLFLCINFDGFLLGQSQWQGHRYLVGCRIGFLMTWHQINEGREDLRVMVMTPGRHRYQYSQPSIDSPWPYIWSQHMQYLNATFYV
jgi:hypothetical protein